MNIAIVIWELNIKGGTQRQALELALALQEQGNSVTVFSYLYDQENCFQELCQKLTIKSVRKTQSSDTRRLPRPISMIFSPIKLVWNMFFDPRVLELRNLINLHSQTEKFDVINLHDYEVYKLARLLKKENLVWMMNDLVGVPPVYERNNKKGVIASVLGYLQLLSARMNIRVINRVVVLDNWNKKLCNQYYGRDAIVIRSGIDLELFKNVPIKKSTERIDIFASGIFFPHRRFEDLVLAGKILSEKGLKNWHITINGSTSRAQDYYLKVKGLIESNKLEQYVTHINGLSEDQLLQHYASSEIFVFPNHEQTWGLSIFEAMLAKCAVIVSQTSGGSEVLTNEVNSLLVPPKSPEAIAAALEQLITQPELREKLASNGKEFVETNLSWGKYAQDMVKVFIK